jgi:RNA polymerase sigma factor (sigma-70 family)
MFTYSENLSKLLTIINKNKEKYKTLSRADEIKLIEKYRYTNPDYLKQQLICHNIYLAISFSKRYTSTSLDYDSLLQDAFYGLSIAAEKFDYDAGVKFSCYAYIWIKKYALSSYYEQHNIRIGLNSISLDSIISTDGNHDQGNDTILQDIFNLETKSEGSEYDKYLNCSATADEYEQTDIEITHSEYYSKIVYMVETSADITLEEKTIFKYIYVNGATLSAVAKQLNKPIQNIRYKRQKVLNYVKGKLAETHNITSFASLD